MTNLPADELLKFLFSHHAFDLEHSGSTLIHHLVGTWRILKAWGLPSTVCDAGLFHSVYGTENFREVAVLSDERRLVEQLIGQRAEQLAYFFGSMKRSSFYSAAKNINSRIVLLDRRNETELYVTKEDFAAISHMLLANWLEQRPRAPENIVTKMDYKFRPILHIFDVKAIALFNKGFEKRIP